MKLRILAQIMKHNAAFMERFGFYRLTVQPKFTGVLSSNLYDHHVRVFPRHRVGHCV